MMNTKMHSTHATERPLSFEEFVDRVYTFVARQASLRDTHYDYLARLTKVVRQDDGVVLHLTPVYRKRRSSPDRFKFLSAEWRVLITPQALFSSLDNGGRLYIALHPSTNHIYLGQQKKVEII